MKRINHVFAKIKVDEKVKQKLYNRLKNNDKHNYKFNWGFRLSFVLTSIIVCLLLYNYETLFGSKEKEFNHDNELKKEILNYSVDQIMFNNITYIKDDSEVNFNDLGIELGVLSQNKNINDNTVSILEEQPHIYEIKGVSKQEKVALVKGEDITVYKVLLE